MFLLNFYTFILIYLCVTMVIVNIFYALLLGAIQGLTEFWPISSSAHLVVLPWIFKFPDPGLTFDVALHLGTLLAVVGYFYKDWLKLIRALGKSLGKSYYSYNYEEKLIWFLTAASIPGFLAGFFLEKEAETIFRLPLIVAFSMIGLGIVLYLVDQKEGGRDLKRIGIKDSLIIGISQALAIIPGISRSGITITAGLWQGLSRKEATKFSFLMATPIILGAAIFKSKDFLRGDLNFDLLFWTGFLSSAFFGFLAIKYLLKFLEKGSFKIFVWYRLVFGVIILLFLYLR